MLGNIVLKTIVLLLSLACGDAAIADRHAPPAAMAAAPAYAKWGRLAMQEAAKAYRNASIIDYRYEGRTSAGPDSAQEVFRLWLREGAKEFGLRVTITFETESERMLDVKLERTDSQ